MSTNISRRALHGIYFRTRRSIAATRSEARRDRLSELSDDILINILERADTLDALRACVLSKRMLRLPAMLSRFDINIESLCLPAMRSRFGISMASLMPHHDEASHRDLASTHLARYNKVLAAVTEKLLRARSLEIPVIRELRVECYLRPDECLAITRAFASTMATHKVESAEFVPLVEKPLPKHTYEDRVCYAKWFNVCLGDSPAAFAGLTRLCLSSMSFGELEISSILTTCKRLEYLRLSYCDTGVSSVLQVEHDQLVELHIRLSLVQTGDSWTKNLQLSKLLAHVPSINDLHLDFRSEKIWVIPERPKLLAPLLGKLKVVNLDNLPEGCDIAWTMFILEAAPSLRELCITVWDRWCIMVTNKDYRREYGYCEKANVEWGPSASAFKHKNLVKLTIYGFQPDENMVRYVRRIMEVAVNMEDISLHDRMGCWCLNPKIKGCPSTYPKTGKEKDILRVEITKGLGMAASPAVIHFRSK